MKIDTRFPLHLQILLALILGAAFGSIFSIDKKLLIVSYEKNSKLVEKEISNWSSITFFDDQQNLLKKFKTLDQAEIIRYYESKLKKLPASLLVVNYGTRTDTISNIKTISKKETIASQIRPIGSIFIRLLSFLAIPLVIASLIVGAASINDIKKLGRIGIKTLTLYLTTTAVAITIGLTVANLIAPGNRIDQVSKDHLIASSSDLNTDSITENIDIDIIDFFVNIVPENPMRAIAEGNMLQIVFFAVMFGITLTFIKRKHSDTVLSFFKGVSETMIKMVNFIMLIAPYGVFALIAATIADFGYSILQTLIWYIFTVIFGLLCQMFLLYPMIIKFIGKYSPFKFYMAMRNAMAIGFSTSSSAATLPVTFNAVEKKIGVPKQISGFVLPLGATINMDGTALYQGVAAVFIAQVYGIDLGIAEQLTIVLTAVLASIGTAPVPGVGIIMLVMILQSINLPPQGIALILGVDRILDMMRTTTNVAGDASIAVAIAGTESGLKK